MKKKIFVTFEPVRGFLEKLEQDFIVIREATVPTTERMIEVVNVTKPDALLVAHVQSYTADTIARLPDSIKIIATCSVGYEHIDLKACAARNIAVTNTPDVLTEACADLTLFVLLGAARRGKEALQLVQDGWGKKLQQNEMLGLDLKGKRLGILGMGRIGQAVAARAKAFGLEIMYSNRRKLSSELENGAQYFSEFHDMLPHCDFLSIHAPSTPETQSLMSKKEFALLPARAVFVNISRGSLVDEEALFEALESRKLFAAGVDVCLHEPNPDARFLKLKNVFMTPHIASATEETRMAMAMRALNNLKASLNGEKPLDLVTL